MAAKTLDEASAVADDQRRDQMLVAAAELIAERGFSETRIADVARRVGASARRSSSTTSAPRTACSPRRCAAPRSRSTTSCAEMLRKTPQHPRPAREPRADDVRAGRRRRHHRHWGLWFDLWAQAFRHPEVSTDRVELDQRGAPRSTGVVKRGHRRGRDRQGRRRGVRRRPGRCCSTACRSRSRCATRSRPRARRHDRDADRRARAQPRRDAEEALTAAAANGRPLVTSGRPSATTLSRRQELICSRSCDVGDEPVDVLVGVLDRHQPLLDLAPRRQEDAAVVLHQPVRLAVPAVDARGSRGSSWIGSRQERDAALGPGGDTCQGRPCSLDRRPRCPVAHPVAQRGRGARTPRRQHLGERRLGRRHRERVAVERADLLVAAVGDHAPSRPRGRRSPRSRCRRPSPWPGR